jgi:chemotaxis receptor (MCP) glutamine deamidase CheD
MARDAWFDLCVTRGETFVANTPDAFAALFFDHALITSMGLGSAVNIPVTDAGLVVGTVNLLAEQGHFTADRMARYQDAVVLRGDGLLTALRERGATPG